MDLLKNILQIACLAAFAVVLVLAAFTFFRVFTIAGELRESAFYKTASSVDLPVISPPNPADIVGSIDEVEDEPRVEGEPEVGDEPVEEVASKNICNRTPELQQYLIGLLQINRCSDITKEELIRVRELSLPYVELKAGDLDGFVNVKEMSLLIQEPLPGMFDDLVGLEVMHLRMESPPSPGMFGSLENLRDLEIYFASEGGAGDIALQSGVLEGLKNLEKLHLDGEGGSVEYSLGLTTGSMEGAQRLQELAVNFVSRVEPGTLTNLTGLRSVQLRARYLPDHLTKPSIQSDLFASNSGLESIYLEGFQDISELEFQSLAVVCRIQGETNLPYGQGFTLVVQGKIVETVDYGWSDESRNCILRTAPIGTENWEEVEVSVQILPDS